MCPTTPAEYAAACEPQRSICGDCVRPVLVVAMRELGEAPSPDTTVVVAEPFEWEPRARCYVCSQVESRVRECPKCRGTGIHRDERCRRCEGLGEVVNNRANCNRCGGVGFVGSARPEEPMLAIDIAWSDEGHVRVIGPNTTRKRGEALYRLHPHNSVMLPDNVPNDVREAA